MTAKTNDEAKVDDCFTNSETSYYGTLKGKKPKFGVQYLILDNYIQRSVESEGNKAKKEIYGIISNFEKINKRLNENLLEKISIISSEITNFRKTLEKVIKDNNLKKPDIFFKPHKTKKIEPLFEMEDKENE